MSTYDRTEIQEERLASAKACFFVVMQHLQVKVLQEELESPGGEVSLNVIAGWAKKNKFQTRICHTDVAGLQAVPIPAIAVMRNGSFVVVGWNDETNVFVLDPSEEKPQSQSKEEFAKEWTGELLLLTTPFDWRRMIRKYNLPWFYEVILKFKKYWRDVVVASVFLQLFGIVVPLFTQVIIDKVLGNQGVSTLDVLGIALVIFGVFQCGMGILRSYFLTHTTNKLDVILGSKLFRQLVSLPLPYFEHRRVGDTMMRIGALASIREFLTGTSITVLLDVVFSIVFVAVMYWFSPSLTVVALAVVPLYLILNLAATPVFQERLEKVWAANSENNAFLVETITGMQTVKALAIEPRFQHRWEGVLAACASRSFDSATLGIGLQSGASVLQLCSNIAIMWVGGNMVMQGELTLGQLIAFQMLAGQANAPIMTLIGMWQQFQQAFLSMDRLSDILNTKGEPVFARVNSQVPLLQGNLEFSNVSFRYRLDQPRVIERISFAVPAGTKVGIVGRSGSGKSTLTKLLQRLYAPEEGAVLIDGINLNQVPPAWLRRQIGVVLQENYLYNASVRDNIAMTNPSASMLEVVAAAKLAGAHEFILELPEGYDTKVGERGASLSGGQRQRISIARALLADPRILIFDEATSALDNESERIIMENLQQMAAGRTLLMIAHRLSTVEHCDVIAVMEKGRIVEAGSHQELLAQNGLYRYLYEQQER